MERFFCLRNQHYFMRCSIFLAAACHAELVSASFAVNYYLSFMNKYWVYIISNKNNSVLYIGVTNNIYRRILEHKEKRNPRSFSANYHLNKLVYYEEFGDIRLAIKREKQLKKVVYKKVCNRFD